MRDVTSDQPASGRSSRGGRPSLEPRILPILLILAGWQAVAMTAPSGAQSDLLSLCQDDQLVLSCGLGDPCSLDDPPANPQPVLFVHGHDFEINNPVPNYKRNWLTKHEWKNNGTTYTLPSFKDAFNAPGAPPLGIEPYFISLSDQHQAIEVDACLIDRAVQRILRRHGDPEAETVKVAIVSYSKGTISSRLYLKHLDDNKIPLPVSEHVAISSPNHGLAFPRFQTEAWLKLMKFLGYNIDITESLALRQLNNGLDENCNSLCCDPDIGTCSGQAANDCSDYDKCQGDPDCEESVSLGFIDSLNGANDGAATPGGRGAGHARSVGTLYLSLYDVDDAAGGDVYGDPSCHRLKARNEGPGAENRLVKVPPDNPSKYTKLVVHANAVHTPEVICKALYTAAHRHLPLNGVCSTKEYEKTPLIPMDHPGVVLLLDVSGSMSRTPAGGIAEEGTSRLDMAESAASFLLQRLLDFYDDKAHFAVATFPVKPQDSASHCEGQVRIPMSLATGEAKDDADAAFKALRAGGNTPLLGGLDKAMATFGGESGKAVVLLTDGMHNCPPGSLPDEQIEALADRRIFVYPVTFGTPGESDLSRLQALASGSGNAKDCKNGSGSCKVGEIFPVTENPSPGSPWDPAAALTNAFKNVFVTAFGLQAGVDPLGVLRYGQKPVTRSVWIHEHDRRVSFALSWTRPAAERLGLRVFTSDAADDEILPTQTGVRLSQGPTYTILTVDERFLSAPGRLGSRWRIEIDPRGLKPGEIETFHYDMILDSALKMDVELDRRDYAAGDPVTLSARLTDAGAPLTGAVVTVEVSRPTDGLGNWFAANPVTPEALGQIPTTRDGDLLSRPLRKYLFLTENQAEPLPGRLVSEPVTLSDDGNGIYTARFGKNLREGTYVFHVRATGGPGTSGPKFQREQLVHRYFTVHPTAEDTAVSVERISVGETGSRRFRLRVSPRDHLGNYLGPRHEGSVAITASRDIFVDGGVEDYLDGSYGRLFELKEGDNPQDIVLTIDASGATQSLVLAEKLPSSWAFSFHLGRSLPRGILSHDFDDGPALGLDLERPITNRLSAVGLLEVHGLRSTAPGVRDAWWWNLSANLKYRGRGQSVPWYLAVGPGVYVSRNDSTRLGANLEIGLEYRLRGRWWLALGVGGHRVFSSGPDEELLDAGLRLILRP